MPPVFEIEISGHYAIIVSAGNKSAATRFVRKSLEAGAITLDDLNLEVRVRGGGDTPDGND